MLEKVDLRLLYDTLEIMDLKDYKEDGTLSYCNIDYLKTMIEGTKTLIQKTLAARVSSNWTVLSQICDYPYNDLVRSVAIQFYTSRDTFSKAFYFVSELKKQQVYYLPDLSIIPKGIPIKNGEEFDQLDISELYTEDNADIDMLFDKIMLVMYKYFHTGQIVINDAEILTYLYALASAASGPREKIVYNCIKNISFLWSTFIVYDRLTQLKKALDYFNTQAKLFLAENTHAYNGSWLLEPRKGNVDGINDIVKNVTENDFNRLLQLMKEHNKYLNKVKKLNINVAGA